MSDDTRWDSVFMNVIQQKQGIDGFFESMFSFLRRNTDFFTDQKKAEGVMVKSCSDQFKIYENSKKSKSQEDAEKAAREEARKQKDEERKQKLAQDSAQKQLERLQKQEEAKKKLQETTEIQEEKPKKEGEDAEEEEKGPVPLGNGGKTDNYYWTQTLEELQVYIPIPSNTKGKMLDINMAPKETHVKLKSETEYLLKGEWFEQINCDESVWTIEDGEVQDYNGKYVHISIFKWKNQWHWWDSVVKGGEKINTKDIQPENSNLADLDGETRSTVEKMMFDMRQKQMGKPSSDEMKKQDMLSSFMEQHPEMDFSKAKFQ